MYCFRCPIWSGIFTIMLKMATYLHRLGNASEAYYILYFAAWNTEPSKLAPAVMILTCLLKVSAVNVGWDTNCPCCSCQDTDGPVQGFL